METDEPQKSETTIEEEAADVTRPENPDPDEDAVEQGKDKLDQAGAGH